MLHNEVVMSMMTFTSCRITSEVRGLISLKNHISWTARGKFTIFAPLYRLLFVKQIFTKGDPNLTFTSCPNRKSKFNIWKTHIGTTTRGKFTMFPPLYRSLFVKNIFIKKVTLIWPLLLVQTGSQGLIPLNKIVSENPHRVKFTILAPLYRSLIVKKYLWKSGPNLTFTSCPNRKSKFNILNKSYVQQPHVGKLTIFAPLYRLLIVKQIFTKRWPQFDLYLLSKPEVKV